ncbi:hypothetical protein SELMODRAFT_432384 [Selaginella moellendorffii]|uniref:Protein kinase domain-containing protein n=1 Tax=Selaginella moellendorffii TaxID=88036 RepID=D8TFU4_SELML|nr:calcium/calmodulin-dependent protein kinase type 1 [Selaginella moellendorffii]EFJ04470.1 hypothetical protein SELMODRAFT_432384 [Selaginella moellendorffii]|eukprot:XP_002994463.1 calcium/calmodulin-dependent protein kinase type 1 [Selaginella moellendorffii]
MVACEFGEDDCGELLKLYRRGEKLGSGGQGQVCLLSARCRAGKKYAGKLVESMWNAENEARLMSKLRVCPGVVAFEDFVREREGGRCYGTIVMELCGPSLAERLIQGGAVTEEEAAKTIKTLAETLKWMHSRGVVHRDLKPHNIFERLNATAVDEVVIGDFGMATDKQWDMWQYRGTAKYMAPEVVAVKSDGARGPRASYTEAVDVWGLGVIAYELLRGYRAGVEFDFLRAGAFLSGFASCEAEDLIQGMLAVEQSKRVTLDAVLAHPWIVKHCGSGEVLVTRANRRHCGVKRRSSGIGRDLIVKKILAG